MMDIPSTGVQSLRPQTFQKAATVRMTRLRGVFWGSGVSSLATAGSPGYLQRQRRQAQEHAGANCVLSTDIPLEDPPGFSFCFAGESFSWSHVHLCAALRKPVLSSATLPAADLLCIARKCVATSLHFVSVMLRLQGRWDANTAPTEQQHVG